MIPFWEYTFEDTPEFIDTFDELPLWSASFGLLLLKHVPMKPDMRVLDLGSGAGFPLLELAERLGSSCTCIGIDPWKNANERANKKIRNYVARHVEVIESSAAQLAFPNDSIDLIVSNLGINNFENPAKVFGECHRVLKPGGKLALTTNLNGHWKVFYEVFMDSCKRLGRDEAVEQLKLQQAHRGSADSIAALYKAAGFRILQQHADQFTMRFTDGSAFLNHHFVKVGWLSSWQSLFEKSHWAEVFGTLEQDLNAYAQNAGGLNLDVPMLYMEGEK